MATFYNGNVPLTRLHKRLEGHRGFMRRLSTGSEVLVVVPNEEINIPDEWKLYEKQAGIHIEWDDTPEHRTRTVHTCKGNVCYKESESLGYWWSGTVTARWNPNLTTPEARVLAYERPDLAPAWSI